ncbi:4Fe-4S binding protein [Desulfofustis glycolicus]|uniref:4Fe-4S dicluster domain-containing protein n=1 Tax=Desulfofustis glycolicus DSM 9705 TaxID=1121409 RepID=A0A1M5SPR1_9BACT|nr:4Fe-4S binding protein [Desulfofustis glycolicus]SHH39953.1 4Fe-4S dicluster domain-containing protein [Desulfofustis glycolicus DSM 9705]
MSREYLFSLPRDLQVELGEVNAATPPAQSGRPYLVANVPSANAEVYAPEINFYLRSSHDSSQVKMESVEKLFDVRACIFEYAQDFSSDIDVDNRVAIISRTDRPQLMEKLQTLGLAPVLLESAQVLNVQGRIGSLQINMRTVDQHGSTVETDQIVWFEAPVEFSRKKGIYDPDQDGMEDVITALCDNYGTLQVRNTKKYDESICLYHGKRHDICGLCVDICPSSAITKARDGRYLRFSEIDCIHCGQCIGICPSGALDSTLLSVRSLGKAVSLYRNKHVLVITARIELETLQVRLPPGVLPFVIEQSDMLHENHLLAVLQASGKPMVIWSDSIPAATQGAIDLVNGIYRRIHDREAIYRCRSLDELQYVLDQLPTYDLPTHALAEPSVLKRKCVSQRIAHLVGEGSFGTVKTDPVLHYGTLTVDRAACTLCLSCADACGVGALLPFVEDNTLRFNPSLCTNCGYCQKTCPEPGCLQTVNNRIDLDPSFFSFQIMAADTIFHCSECGAAIGPSKSIEKIAAMMKPLFAGDPTRLKTLTCCPDCKAKLMVAAMHP